MKKKLYVIAGALVLVAILAVMSLRFYKNKEVAVQAVLPSSAEIIKQENGKVFVKMRIADKGEKFQTDLQYSAALYASDDRGIITVNSFGIQKYNDPIVLSGGGVVEREIVYNIPQYLDGKYRLAISVVNSTGMPFDFLEAGELQLLRTEDYVGVDPLSCVVHANNEDRAYSLYNGVDVKANETLNVSCNVRNFFDHDVVVVPQWQNYSWQYILGKKVDQEAISSEPITLASRQITPVTLQIPKALKPQAYDARLILLSDGKEISNDAIVHYVLSGESAAISGVTLDKIAYKSGEKAQVQMQWTGSADNFSDSRLGGTTSKDLSMNVAITDQQGKNCLSKEFSTPLGTPGKSTLSVAMDYACIHPIILAKIVSSNGNVLAEQKFYTISQLVADKSTMFTETFWKKFLTILFSILAIAVIVFVIMKRRFMGGRGMNMVALLFLCGSLFILSSGKVQAWCEGYTRDCYHSGIDYICWNSSHTETCNNLCGNKHHRCQPITGYSGWGGCVGGWQCQVNPIYGAEQWDPCNNVSASCQGCAMPVNGACAATHNNCAAGSLGATGADAYQYAWWCNGSGGGSNAYCTEVKVTGACSASHYACTAGSPSGAVEDGVSYQWWCNSPNGGSNKFCYEAKPTLTFSATPATIPYGGGNATLSWSTTNATSCWSSGGQWPDGDIWRNLSNPGRTDWYGATSILYLECWSATGVSTGIKSVTITKDQDLPPTGLTITGPNTGNVNTTYSFTVNATDPESNNITYKFTWGDGGIQSNSPPAASGTPVSLPHNWTTSGSKTISVTACDSWNVCSAPVTHNILISDCVATNPVWSKCTQSCGNDGTQNRSVLNTDCSINNQTQDCNRVDCPQWKEVIP